MDALVLVDLELVVAQVASPGVGIGRPAGRTPIPLRRSRPRSAKRQHRHGRQIHQIVVAEPAGQLGPVHAEELPPPAPAHEERVDLRGRRLAVGDGADHVGVAGRVIAGDEKIGHRGQVSARQPHVLRAGFARLATGRWKRSAFGRERRTRCREPAGWRACRRRVPAPARCGGR